MSICAAEKDRILFDYIINYVFPQYALPWNNFYTNIDSIPYNLRNDERNTNARVARSPLVVTASPELVTKSDASLPDWSKTIDPSGNGYASSGTVVNTSGTKVFLGKLISNGCAGFDYSYLYTGRFDNANFSKSGSSSWIILHLNLTQKANGTSSTSVVVVSSNGPSPTAFSTLNGTVVINDTRLITIKNPIPLGLNPADASIVSAAIQSGDSNTVYGLYGNRIFIAINVQQIDNDSNASLNYDITFRVAETSGAIIPYAVAGLGPFVPV